METDQPFEGAMIANDDTLESEWICPECTAFRTLHQQTGQPLTPHNKLKKEYQMVKCHWLPTWEPRETLIAAGFDVPSWERNYRDKLPTHTRRTEALDFDLTDLDKQIHHRVQTIDMHTNKHLWDKLHIHTEAIIPCIDTQPTHESFITIQTLPGID